MYTKDLIQKRFNSGEKLSYVFFFRPYVSADGKITESCLCQWWQQPFTIDGITYCCAEQWMMTSKARLFLNNKALETKILKTKDPKAVKALGREVRNFDKNTWNENKVEIVKRGNIAKFSQNPDLKEYLLSTGNKVLVEASPYDDIWGVKLAARDKAILNPNNWIGENLLGFILMEVRDLLK